MIWRDSVAAALNLQFNSDSFLLGKGKKKIPKVFPARQIIEDLFVYFPLRIIHGGWGEGRLG